MTGFACVFMLLLLTPQKVGEVETHFDKKADFSSFHTYAWASGHDAFDPNAHKAIIAAFEQQMTALGFKKVEPANADVFLTYHTVRGSEVDLKTLDKLQREGANTSAATKILGRLAVVMSQPKSREMLWSAGTRRRLSDDQSKWNEELQAATTAIFDTYPGRKKKNS
jgi:Domain of unknown function (DUF4136)